VRMLSEQAFGLARTCRVEHVVASPLEKHTGKESDSLSVLDEEDGLRSGRSHSAGQLAGGVHPLGSTKLFFDGTLLNGVHADARWSECLDDGVLRQRQLADGCAEPVQQGMGVALGGNLLSQGDDGCPAMPAHTGILDRFHDQITLSARPGYSSIRRSENDRRRTASAAVVGSILIMPTRS
jgi:hypothetical protein